MEVRAPWLFLLLMDICLLGLTTFSKGEECGSPPVPLNARISTENVTLTPGTSIVYTCDSGYELFGSGDKLTCGENGQWSGQMPFCGVDVAYRKPANQSTTARGGDASHGNDGNWNTLHEGKFCTETRKEPSPWWRVDLLRPYDVRTIRIVTPSGGQHRVQDLEIRVGNSTVVSRNRLCAWQPGNLEPGVKQDLSCARASVGRYVFIQMVGVEGALSLCEVQIFTTSETSPERCETSKSSDVVRSFDSLCYEFQLKQGSNFQGARKRCQSLGGDLVHDISNVTKNFLVGELEMMRGSMTTQLVWIGANKEPGSSNTWHWVGGGAVATPMWGPDQPNNYNGEQNCVVLDGGRGWLWNDVGCNLNYLPWVCQYDPPACGSPDKAVNTTIERPVNGYGVGFILKYRCPNDSMIVGNDTRVCQKDGAWSGVAPTCRYVDCGALQSIHNGRVDLLDRRTTYNATALYVCNENYTLVGAPRRTCDAEGRWTGDVPSCLYMFCPKPEVPINGTVNLTKALVVESVAIYSCHRGHHLVGQSERVCLIGGKWTGTVPTCKYTDCGDPRPVDHGIFVLPSNSTLYGAEVVFLCSDDYELKGPEKRVCTENGTWSEEDPTCQIISCGEPDFRQGSYVVVDGFTIKSTVQYICELGHVMEGEPNRTCEADGKWSADAPRCRFVECGHVQPVLHGQVDFLNFTTHLNSIVNYSCAPGYRLNGNGTRVCETSGRWSGTTPFCEEIRCTEPNRPPNSVLSVSGNDRSGDGDTFKVGSTVQFRCEKGYTFHGGTVLTCERDGIWTGAPPVCLYVDCLFPEPITNGEFTLLSNTTYYASVVEYVCDDHYEIVGNARRTCLENGTWEGSPPKCHEINCGAPDKPPSVSSIEVANYTVDSVAVYRCSVGQKIVGNATRVCLRTGQWSSSAPTCEWVDCGRPGSPQNGEIYLLNQSTTYMSVMEYHCFFGYKLVGPAIRSCHVNGKWNGVDGKCELDTTNTDVLGENSLTKPVASAGEETEGDIVMSKTIGVAIGVGAGGVLLLTIIIALVYMKLRRPKPSLPQGETVPVQTTPVDRGYPPMATYANMETDLSNGVSHPVRATNGNGVRKVGYPLPEIPTR